MPLRTLARQGRYLRLADPGWSEPLDGSYSGRAGGRWNPPGAFPVVYLNRTLQMARLQAEHKYRGTPYKLEDLDEDELPVLVETDIEDTRALDCVTDDGLVDCGLTGAYPLDGNGEPVPHQRCQPIGQRARADGLGGVACRTAAAPAFDPELEELALFSDGRELAVAASTPFGAWYWPARTGGEG